MTALYLVCLRDRPVTTHVPLFIKTLSQNEIVVSFGCLEGDESCCKQYSKQILTLRQASEESACFLLSFFCDD